MKKIFNMAALGVVAVFAVLPTPASAGPYSGRYGIWAPRFSSYGWGPRYYYRGYYYLYAIPYPLNPTVEARTATIRMSVPTDAKVWLEGEATSQTGTVRDYITPALAPGSEYVYHVRVTWNENNKPMEQKSDIKLHAGDMVNFALSK